MIIPTPETYAEWVNERKQRTLDVMARQSRISGRQVADENLSARMIYDAGYVLDASTDTLEKK